jgi:hypothetical protein
MFGEKFLNSFKMANSKKGQEPEVIHKKGSLENPYSLAELQSLKNERLRDDHLMHFDGYIKEADDPKNSNIRYSNFIVKDSNDCSVNLSPSQRRTYARLDTIKNEQGSSISKLSFSAREGILNKKIVFKISHDLPFQAKKEIVDTVYRKLEEKKFTSNYVKWDKEAKDALETECREEFLSTVAGIVRKNVAIPDDSLADVEILH